MILKRETDYAIRIIRAVSDGSQKSVVHIAEEHLIPQQFAYKIVRKLHRAGILSVTRGAEGGCRLQVDLHDISLYELMVAMDEVTLLSACMQQGYECSWREQNRQICQIHQRLSVIQRNLDNELKSHSLYDLIFGPSTQEGQTNNRKS